MVVLMKSLVRLSAPLRFQSPPRTQTTAVTEANECEHKSGLLDPQSASGHWWFGAGGSDQVWLCPTLASLVSSSGRP